MLGRMGKGCVLAIGVALSACTTSSRYAGTVTTQAGSCGLGFDSAGRANATLLVHGDDIQFLPTDGVTVLPGHVDGAGHMLAGSNAPGADRKPFQQVFEGDRDGDAVTGRFASPRCRAMVALSRK